ncbi:MAG: biotin--[acetyl-CoA-carboxylase] ligase [Chlamydiales bacterium]
MQIEKIHLEKIDSTNKWAKENLTTLKSDTFYVVRADEQTSGYGRRGHKWIAAKGNLILTLVFPVTESPHLLTHKLCLCLAKTLEEFSLRPQIKWPNDLLLNGKKIAGVICEVSSNIAYLGLGLNVNVTPFQPATSLQEETGSTFDLDQIEKSLIKNFLQNRSFDSDEYQKRLCFLNKVIFIEDEDKIYTGACVGIDPSGALLLEENKKIIKIFSGDIKS